MAINICDLLVDMPLFLDLMQKRDLKAIEVDSETFGQIIKVQDCESFGNDRRLASALIYIKPRKGRDVCCRLSCTY